MKSNIREEDIIFRYPSKEEIKAAQLACCGRCCDACETPAEYAWRKRGVDMAILLEKAIEAELSESERKAVRAHWYESMSVKEIAASQGISSAAVSVTLKRAQDKLHRALRPMEHTAWLPEGCLPKGQPSEEGAESALARGNFIFTLQELEGLPLSFKVLSQRCLWGSRPLKEPEPLIYFVGWSLKPSIGGKKWRCADREGR